MNEINLTQLNDIKKTTKPGEIKANCPFCGSTGHKLGINLKKGIFHCFKCDASGKLEDFKINVDAFQSKVEGFKNGSKTPAIQSIVLPSETITPVSRTSGRPFMYLKNRGLTESDIRRYSLGYCSEGLYGERIILPIYGEDGSLLYFIARAYANRQPKYLNVGTIKRGVIFKTFTGSVDFCILVEGAFDAISVAKVFPAIALLGKVCHEHQAEKIAKLTKKVYVMLDQDAPQSTFKVACQLSHYVKAIPIFINKKDPGEMTPEEIRKEIKNEDL